MDGYKNERENYQEEIQFVTVEIGHPVPVLSIPSSKRTRLSASARREKNWSINCVSMRVMDAVKETIADVLSVGPSPFALTKG